MNVRLTVHQICHSINSTYLNFPYHFYDGFVMLSCSERSYYRIYFQSENVLGKVKWHLCHELRGGISKLS